MELGGGEGGARWRRGPPGGDGDRPPGFQFHPTNEELVVQYLRRKALSRLLPAAIIPVNHDHARLDPWDLPGASEGEGYFFSAPSSSSGRWRRASSGYWKATGKEKPVFLQCGGKRQLLVSVKTALAFHRSEPSSSQGTAGRRREGEAWRRGVVWASAAVARVIAPRHAEKGMRL